MSKTYYQKAYQEVCKILGVKPAKVGNISDIEDATTVIVPNKIFTHEELFNLIEEFSEKQPYPSYITEEFYKLYTPVELYGQLTNGDYRVFYIPNKFNVAPDTVINQKANTEGHVP